MTTIPIRRVTVSTVAGADPDAIDDATEVYGDFPDIVELCNKSPRGQCEYASWHFNHARCVWCNGGDGV